MVLIIRIIADIAAKLIDASKSEVLDAHQAVACVERELLSQIEANTSKKLNSQTCFAIIEAIRTEDARWVTNAISRNSGDITRAGFDVRSTDTGTNIWLPAAITIEIVKGVEHQFPSLQITIFVAAVNNALSWRDNVHWQTESV